jgi:hyaluronoglucosaminidase
MAKTPASARVPTDIGTSSSSYKSTLGANLQADIMIGWTGPEVTPPDITVSHMSTANSFFGRKLFIWDNFPCNDYGPTASRLLMGAYQTRQSGLSNVINGLVSNPMNQAAASKPALTGVAAFAWNDLNYNKTTAWNWGMAWMAKGNPQLTADLQVFGDLNFAWPYSNTFVVPQSPTLRSLATGFAASPAGSDLTALTAYADSMANGTGRIRTQLGDPIFISDADPWLTAATSWGQSLQHAIAAVVAARAGDTALVTTETTAASARTTAQAVRITNKQNRWSETATPAPKLGDGVLDAHQRPARQGRHESHWWTDRWCRRYQLRGWRHVDHREFGEPGTSFDAAWPLTATPPLVGPPTTNSEWIQAAHRPDQGRLRDIAMGGGLRLGVQRVDLC